MMRRFSAICLLFFVFSTFVFPQISGKVYNVFDGSPLPGALIIVDGGEKNEQSDSLGNFTIRLSHSGDHSIEVRCMGFETVIRKINLNNSLQRTINVGMVPALHEMKTVIIAATRSETDVSSIAGRVYVMGSEEIATDASVSADELLSRIPGVYSERLYGLSNKSGNINMRGMNRNVQTLILVDGVPYTLVDGGASSWNRIDPDNIERIEVVKGPSSTIFGSNAMGGVINIVTKNPKRPFEGNLRAMYGTFNTAGVAANLRGMVPTRKDHYFYWIARGNFRRSDGYYLSPDSLRSKSDTTAFFHEYATAFRLGYNYGKGQSVEISYEKGEELRNSGTRNYEKLGSYTSYDVDALSARLRTAIGKSWLDITAFFRNEDMFKQSEGVKRRTGKYTFIHTESPETDYGLLATWKKQAGKNYLFTAGFDFRSGMLGNNDIYRTSTDTISYFGKMDFFGMLLLGEYLSDNNKLIINAGARFDMVRSYDGRFSVSSPSAASAYLVSFDSAFNNNRWNAFSPRLALKYQFLPQLFAYIQYSSGFRPPTLSDMFKTGEVEKGFKLANPLLIPEKVTSLETGLTWKLNNVVSVEPSFWFTKGYDFQYFVSTGDSLITSGDNPRPVIRRQNIDGVRIYGAEALVKWAASARFDLLAAYTYTNAAISGYVIPEGSEKDLDGKYLIEVPAHMVFTGVFYSHRSLSASFHAKYRSNTWADDDNTITISSRLLFDAKLGYRPLAWLAANLTVQNLMNVKYSDSKGLLSPGRFVITELVFRF